MTDAAKAARAALPNTKPGDEWMDSEMTNHVRALLAEYDYVCRQYVLAIGSDERDLLAEIKRLRQRWGEQLRSENTRLHDLDVSLNKSEHDAHMLRRAEVGEARAENERLRAALKTISSEVDVAKRIAAREMRELAAQRIWDLTDNGYLADKIRALPVEGE